MEVLISGYYGFKNTGDEAILEALLSGLRKQAPGLSLKVMSADPVWTSRVYNVSAVQRLDLKALVNCDIFISGGGGLLQDKTSLHSFYYYLGLILLAKLLGKRVYVFAQGIGPVRFRLNRLFLKLVFRFVDLITVRDQGSFNFIKSLKVKNPKVLETADPTLLLSPEDGQRTLELEGIKGIKRRIVGVSMREGAGKKVSILAEFLDWLSKEKGYYVVFVPFEYPRDVEISNQVMRLMGEESSLIFRELKPREVLGVISKMDLFVGMRLHSLIFSLINKVPALGLAYDPKVPAFMEEVGFPWLPLEELELKGLKAAFLELEEAQEKIKTRLDLERRKMGSRAFLNFGMIDILKDMVEKRIKVI